MPKRNELPTQRTLSVNVKSIFLCFPFCADYVSLIAIPNKYRSFNVCAAHLRRASTTGNCRLETEVGAICLFTSRAQSLYLLVSSLLTPFGFHSATWRWRSPGAKSHARYRMIAALRSLQLFAVRVVDPRGEAGRVVKPI